MMTSLPKVILLCCLIILTTTANEVAEDEVQEVEKDKGNSKGHALVALDAEVTDDEEGENQLSHRCKKTFFMFFYYFYKKPRF